MIEKFAKVVKRKNKWCIQSHKTGKIIPGTCYDTKEKATKRLQQMSYWKHKKGELLKSLTEISDDVDRLGLLHVADVISNCIEIIANGTLNNQTAIKIGKVVNLLQKKGHQDLSERLDSLLPDIVYMKGKVGNLDDQKTVSHKMSSLRAYNVVKLWQNKYASGEINKTDFEYARMKELERLLKRGFSLPLPITYKNLPTDADNWWDHYENKQTIKKG